MKYFEFFKMLEKKDHLINKMNITDEQKQIAIEFFNKHPNYESDVDWNRKDLSWEDLEKVIYKQRNTKSQFKKAVKSGIEGIVEGEDYLSLAEGTFKGKSYKIYQPLTWLGSRTLASNNVPPVLTSLKEDEAFSGARWCIAYQKDSKDWNRYLREGKTFLFAFGEGIYTKKSAIEISKPGESSKVKIFRINCWDAADNPYITFNVEWDKEQSSFKEACLALAAKDYSSDVALFTRFFPESVLDLVEVSHNNYELVRERTASEETKVVEMELEKLLALNNYEETHILNIPRIYASKFASEGSLTEKYFIKDGKFRFNIGKVEGNFNCENIRELSSLENGPKEVTGTFNISGTSVESFEGCPEKIGKNFIARGLSQVLSIDTFPKYIGGIVDLSSSYIESIEGLYNSNIKEAIILNYCAITSLKGIPEGFEGDVVAKNADLETLEGCPEGLAGLDVSGCYNLYSIEDLPEVVRVYVDISDCDNIEDINEDQVTITGSIYYGGSNIDDSDIEKIFDADQYYKG